MAQTELDLFLALTAMPANTDQSEVLAGLVKGAPSTMRRTAFASCACRRDRRPQRHRPQTMDQAQGLAFGVIPNCRAASAAKVGAGGGKRFC